MGVGLGSAGVKLDRSWAHAGRGLKQNLAQAELDLSWDGLGWSSSWAWLNIPGGRRKGGGPKNKIGHISKSVSSYEMEVSPTQVCHP